jgi:hypothetical protein
VINVAQTTDYQSGIQHLSLTTYHYLHWSLNVAFNKDKNQLKDKNTAFSCTALRRFILVLIKNAKISNNSIKSQRLQIGWNDQLLKQYFEAL